MKRFVLCCILAAVCFSMSAQVASTTIVKKPYRELKGQYDPHLYTPVFTDRYSPGGSGIASAFIPGLGQAINGEWGRAVLEFLAPAVLVRVGTGIYISSDLDSVPFGAVLCYAGALAVDVFSIVDAVRIAKVKNMYMQDMMDRASVDVRLSPSLAYVRTGGGLSPTAGMTLALSF